MRFTFLVYMYPACWERARKIPRAREGIHEARKTKEV